jgi:hypothetical protein
MVTFTNRRVYWILFFARPLGTFFFSCGSTCDAPSDPLLVVGVFHRGCAYLWGLRLDLTGTGEGAVHFTHGGGVVCSSCVVSEVANLGQLRARSGVLWMGVSGVRGHRGQYLRG